MNDDVNRDKLLEIKERAENYTEKELQKYTTTQSFRINQINMESFLKSNSTNILCIHGAKGMGKTMMVKLALLGKNYNYIPYFAERNIEQFPDTGHITVIDDIHYMMDDIKAGLQDCGRLEKLLIEALNNAIKLNKKIILVSEDAFTENYIDCDEYRYLWKKIKAHEWFIRTDGLELCNILGVTDSGLRALMSQARPTARGAIAFIKNNGTDWGHICDETRRMVAAEPDFIKAFIEEEYPTPTLTPPTKPPSLKEKEIWMNVLAENKKEIWMKLPLEIRQQFWTDKYNEAVKRHTAEVNTLLKNIDSQGPSESAAFRLLVLEFYNEEIYKDQSYMKEIQAAIEKEDDE